MFEVDESALPEAISRTRPRVVSLANLFRDQLDRYGELELIAERWRDALRALPDETTLVVNADDPVVAELADGENARCASASTIRGTRGRPSSTLRTPSTACAAGRPYEYAAAYVGHLGDYRCPACDHARPPLDVAAREIELKGLIGSQFRLVSSLGDLDVELTLPGLYNVYNATAAASLAFALGASPAEVRDGLASFSAAFGVSSGSRPARRRSSFSSSRTRRPRTKRFARSRPESRRCS